MNQTWITVEGQRLESSRGYLRVGNTIVRLDDKGHITEQHILFATFSSDNWSDAERNIIKRPLHVVLLIM